MVFATEVTVLLRTGDSPDAVAALETIGTHMSSKGLVKFFGPDGKPIAETADWRLYVAELPDPKGQLGLFMISTKPESNHVIDWQSYIISTMQSNADKIDSATRNKEFAPRYGTLFPKVFEKVSAGDRSALIMGFSPDIKAYRQLRPLSTIPANKRIDLKSVTWILAKSLKLAALFHTNGLTIGKVTADNLFVTMDDTSYHGVLFLDFTYADSNATDYEKCMEIADLTKTVWEAAGGTESSDPPWDRDLMSRADHDRYVENLRRMMEGNAVDADAEIDLLYEVNDQIWPKVRIPNGPNSRGQTHKRQWHEFHLRDR